MMKRSRIALAAAAAALALAAPAGAATIADLQAAGYTVSIASQIPKSDGTLCNVYAISAPWGVSTYANDCDASFAATLDSLVAPATLCNAKWQWQHPDQLAALESIGGKGYQVSGDQCADTYTVVNPNDGTTVYSGAGAGLPGLDSTLGPAPTGTGGAGAAAPSTNGGTGGFCLPLCATGGGTVAPAGTTGTTSTSTSTAQPLYVYDPRTGTVSLASGPLYTARTGSPVAV